MSDEGTPLYERLAGEPALWYRRFERFRLMEPVRSVAAVYQEEHPPASSDVKIRQKVPGTWYEQAKRWRWEERAAAWDADVDAQIEQVITAERKKILRSRYALQHKRIELLDRKVAQLAEMTDDDKSIWIPDVKSVGTGPNATRVDLVQFNDAAFRELREYLTDIADELGERVKLSKQEHSGAIDMSGARDELLAKLAAFESNVADDGSE